MANYYHKQEILMCPHCDNPSYSTQTELEQTMRKDLEDCAEFTSKCEHCRKLMYIRCAVDIRYSTYQNEDDLETGGD